MSRTALPPPFPHQTQGAEYIAQLYAAGLPGAYLAHAVGTGKTRTALAVARYHKWSRVIVLSPPVGLGVWEREIEKWWPKSEPATVLKLHNKWPDKIPTPKSGTMFVITTYDQLVSFYGEQRLKALLKWKADAVILDEAHYVKTPTAYRTKAVTKLVKNSKRLLLSGTPAHNALDWWSQYRLVAPDSAVWSSNFGDYKRNIAILGGPQQNWVQGFKQDVVDEVVNRHVLPYTHVVPPNVLNLPEPLDEIIDVELDAVERAVYNDMRTEMVAYLNDQTVSAETALVQAMKLHQITGGFVKPDGQLVPQQVGTSKRDACIELLDTRYQQKVIVAFKYLAELQEIRDILERKRRRVMVITGATKPEDRTRIENEFQNAEVPFVLLCQYRAAGTSITLTAASTMILYSMEPSSIAYEQMRGRIWRSGQTGHVQILHLAAKDTIDTALIEGVRSARDTTGILSLVKRSVGARV